MATVQGIREQVNTPVFDCIFVEPAKQLREVEAASTLKFFVNVQGKTKLETNLQSASLLPHFNTFEARAMRVVISDLPPEFSDEVDVEIDGEIPGAAAATGTPVTVTTDLKRAMELLGEAREDPDNEATITVDKGTNVPPAGEPYEEADDNTPLANEADVTLALADIESAIEDLDRDAPPLEQIRPNDNAGNLISKLIYNTVTTLFVGEKIMIEMPTWFFPGGAGPYSLSSKVISHGEPSPLATFRFAEPIFIDKQQNFRVEMDIPDSDTHKEIQKIYGPLFIWVVLDGYMTRDVQ
jgi:hypothetical protein